MNESTRIWVSRLATGHVSDGCAIQNERYAWQPLRLLRRRAAEGKRAIRCDT
jgi:hypothetical protein